jgi:hypothetical protein
VPGEQTKGCDLKESLVFLFFEEDGGKTPPLMIPFLEEAKKPV